MCVAVRVEGSTGDPRGEQVPGNKAEQEGGRSFEVEGGARGLRSEQRHGHLPVTLTPSVSQGRILEGGRWGREEAGRDVVGVSPCHRVAMSHYPKERRRGKA